MEKNQRDIFLSWIRGLLGILAGIELIGFAVVLQGILNQINSAGAIPTSLIPLLNFTQVSVVVAVTASILLFSAMVIRLMEPLPRRRPAAPTAPTGSPPSPPMSVCPKCGRRDISRFCPVDGSPMEVAVD